MAITTKYRIIRDDFSLDENNIFRSIAELEPVSVANSIHITWNKAKNFSVFDDLGNKWIDLTSGIFVANAGHSNPFIKQAIKDQLDSDLLFAYNYPTSIKLAFLKKLLALSPKYFEKVALLNSGSEAVDVAYKLMRLYGKKNKKKYIVTFRGSYHGRGLSNDMISGREYKACWSGISDPSIFFINFPYNSGTPFKYYDLPPLDEIAGFFLETFQGWGAWFYPQKFINDLCSFAKEVGALVCFDEMQSGFFRLGPIYGYMTYGENIKPDIICLGKGISSSLPLSAVLSTREIMDLDVKADLHGTQSANALCVAAGLANIEFLSDIKQIKKREKTSKLFVEKMNEIKRLPLVKAVNVRGLIAGIIFKNTELATNIVKRCIQNGVLPVCTNRESIKIAPPLTITENAIEEAISVLKSCIKKEVKC